MIGKITINEEMLLIDIDTFKFFYIVLEKFESFYIPLINILYIISCYFVICKYNFISFYFIFIYLTKKLIIAKLEIV